MKTMEIDANINWKLLQEQKEALMEIMECGVIDPNSELHDNAFGLIPFIDSIQDKAVEDGIATEEVVFNSKTCDNERIANALLDNEAYKTSAKALLVGLLNESKPLSDKWKTHFKEKEG